MDLFRVALGDDRILGEKFPQAKRLQAVLEPDGDESDRFVAARRYAYEKQNPDWEAEFEHSKKMNPNGFWEMRWSVAGIQYEYEPPASDRICKIVSQGLARSNPAYIDKIVMMIRHPYAVAQSQQDLTRRVPFLRADGRKVKQDELRVLSPEMYINVSVAVAGWFAGPGKDTLVHRVNFDDLVSEPEPTLRGLGAFVGEGDWDAAIGRINPKLRRSPRLPGDEHSKRERWDLALAVHDQLSAGNWEGVLEIARAEAERRKAAPPDHFFCPRWGGSVNPQQCGLCRSDPTVRNNMRNTAERRRIDWPNEPCLWEVAYAPDREVHLTIGQSVASNHWVEDGGGDADAPADTLSIAGADKPRSFRSKIVDIVGGSR